MRVLCVRHVVGVVTLTRRSLSSWQIVASALVSRSCQRWSEDTARHVWLPLCRAVSLTLVTASPGGAASTWHVKAGAAGGGDGSQNRPFASLQEVEARSQPGDTIRVVPSDKPLDGGIQLKDGQRLIGLGNPVTKSAGGARPTITNSSNARYDGDAVRLANNNLVAEHPYRRRRTRRRFRRQHGARPGPREPHHQQHDSGEQPAQAGSAVAKGICSL